jgi:DNA polymerase II small subunit/DNA polymerase delta subunit B
MKRGMVGLTFLVVLTMSSARAEGVITRIYNDAVTHYAACIQLFDQTEALELIYPLRVKEAKVEADNCRRRELERSKEAANILQAAANDDPSKLDAVRSFRTYWETTLTQTPNVKAETFKEEFKDRLDRLRTDLNLEW